MRSLPILAIALVALAVALPAQMTLTTTFVSNNGQSGNMFDLVTTTNTVTICSFDVNLDPGTWNMEIYTKAGPYLPDVNNPGPWGPPIASLTGVVSNGIDVPTPLGLSLGVTILPQSTQSFYVTVTNGTSMNYTNGTVTGAIFAQDANLQFLEGAGLAYPFASNFNPRVWNGNIHYTLGSGPCPDFTLDIIGGATGMGTYQIDVALTGGVPVDQFFTCITINGGNFPNGYWFGIDPLLAELTNQIFLPFPPFNGFLDAVGGSTTSFFIPGNGPLGVTVYGVSISWDPTIPFAVRDATPPIMRTL